MVQDTKRNTIFKRNLNKNVLVLQQQAFKDRTRCTMSFNVTQTLCCPTVGHVMSLFTYNDTYKHTLTFKHHFILEVKAVCKHFKMFL